MIMICISGVCGALTIYSAISLTLYSRRQKVLWVERQLQILDEAQIAYANGTANEEQLEIVRNEQIGEIEKRIREEAKEKRLWNRTKRYLFSGLKEEEAATVAAGPSSSSTPSSPDKIRVLDALDAKK